MLMGGDILSEEGRVKKAEEQIRVLVEEFGVQQVLTWVREAREAKYAAGLPLKIEKGLVTMREASDITKIPPKTLDSYLRRGHIKHHGFIPGRGRGGREILIDLNDVQEYLASKEYHLGGRPRSNKGRVRTRAS